MKIDMIGAFRRNYPFGTEIAFMLGLRKIGVDVGWWDPSVKCYDNWHGPKSVDAIIMFNDGGPDTYDVCRSYRDAGAMTIEYQLDDIRAPGIRDMMARLCGCCDYAFTFDKTGADVAEKELGYKRAKKLLVTADPDLYRCLGKRTKDIDFCFIGNYSNPVMHKSRRRMLNVLVQSGFERVVSLTFFDPMHVNVIYNRSKVVLNHATDVGQEFGSGYGYQCRHFEAGFAGSCVMSNVLLDDEGDGPKTFVQFHDEESLIENAHELIHMYDDGSSLYESIAEALSSELNDKYRPEHRAKEIVEFIEEMRQ